MTDHATQQAFRHPYRNSLSHIDEVHRLSFKGIKFCEQINKVEFSCSSFIKVSPSGQPDCVLLYQKWKFSNTTNDKRKVPKQWPPSFWSTATITSPRAVCPTRPSSLEGMLSMGTMTTNPGVALCVLRVYCYFNLLLLLFLTSTRT